MAANNPIWKGLAPGSLTETPKSGTLKFAERVTYTQELRGRYGDAVLFASAHYRGTMWTIALPSGMGSFIVDDCSVAKDRGGEGTVTINYNYLGTPPPQEFCLTPFEVNPPTQKAGFFSALTTANLSKTRAAFNASTAAGAKVITDGINAITDAGQKALCLALLDKWFQGQETFYLAGFKFQRATFFYYFSGTPSRGGFLQTPTGNFSDKIPGGMGWLRQADELVWNNGLWKLTENWLGGPGGWWDGDIYGT